jgi:transposase
MADAGLNDSHQGSTYRRIELITGEAKRRLWTAEEKAGILSESFRPGAKVAEVARRHGVSRSLLWNWRHEARKRGMVAERAFVPVRVAEEATTLRPPMAMEQCAGSASAAAQLDGTTAGSPTGTIDIELGGARLRISGAVDTAILRQVLTYLGRKP